MDMFEPTGFGRFDPSTFGMWLNVDAAYQRQDYTTLTPLMWSTFHSPLSDAHKEYVRSAKSREDAVFAASCFTVATHERRHFHDLIATPYGSMLARQNIRAAFYCAVLVDEVLFRRDRIVVPLNEWCQNAELFQTIYDIAPPSNCIIHINNLFGTMQDKLTFFDHGRLNRDRTATFPTASSILESIAVMVQLREIGEEFGLEYGESFGKSIIDSKSKSRYFGALRLVQDTFGTQLPIAIESLLLQASLYGNFQDPDPNRFQYPTDLLMSLLDWLRENRFTRFLNTASSGPQAFDYTVEFIDNYFKKVQGGNLQSMIQSASNANRCVLAALAQELTDIEQSAGREKPFCRTVLEVFQNFIDVHESFSKKVCNNLPWYMSYDYIRDKHENPEPVVFIESHNGIPVDSTLGSYYYIQSEDRIYITSEMQKRILTCSSDSEAAKMTLNSLQTVEELKQETILNLHSITGISNGYEETILKNKPETLVLRNAYVMSPRNIRKSEVSDEPVINTSLWQRNYDQIGHARLFLEGPNQGMPQSTVRDILSALKNFHTDVFTSSGKLEAMSSDPNEIPDLISNALDSLQKLKTHNKA